MIFTASDAEERRGGAETYLFNLGHYHLPKTRKTELTSAERCLAQQLLPQKIFAAEMASLLPRHYHFQVDDIKAVKILRHLSFLVVCGGSLPRLC